MKALEVARLNQSSQTGFMHRGDLIPIYENLCFALSLFRAHTVEQMAEGKDLLRQLFGFFSNGFPMYLHDYPNIALPTHQLRCALPLHWIFKCYSHVIEEPLKSLLKKNYQILIDQKESSLSPLYQCLFQAFHGKKLMRYKPQFSYELGFFLLIYQILDETPAWILDEALGHWHPELMTYSGLPIQEYQNKNQPEVTLYDLFMAEYQEKFSDRILKCYSLQGALVFPFKTKRELISSPSSFQMNNENTAWNPKGFHLIRFLWGSGKKVRSFVCQENMRLKKKGDRLEFLYPEEIPLEKRQIELCFFTEYGEDVQLFVEGKKQTVFYLGETIEIRTIEKRVKLRFSLEEGDGLFMGHISRGNRPAQIGFEGPKDFSSYDWKIGLRSLHRSSHLVIGLSIL